MTVLKTHVIKSPNLLGWLHWRFAAINVENRGNGHTWRMPANLIDDNYLTCQISAILYADRGDRRIKSPSVPLAFRNNNNNNNNNKKQTNKKTKNQKGKSHFFFNLTGARGLQLQLSCKITRMRADSITI